MEHTRHGREAVDALVGALESIGTGPGVELGSISDVTQDLVVSTPDGRSIDVQVETASLVSAESAPGQLRRWSRGIAANVVGVVVADRITAEAREDLNRAGWSWLDLRGHLRLSGPGLFIDSDVPAAVRERHDRAGISGQVGVELASLLLLRPTEPPGVRGAAKALSRAPSSVSDAFGALRTADLVDGDHRPAVPDLFWELAEHWRPVGHDVARLPGPGEARDIAALHLGLEDIESTIGWALTDTVAASDLGAPIARRADHPPDFLVPDQATLRRAVRVLGSASAPSSRAARILVAPVSLACSRRIDASGWADQPWPLTHPLFVALELARDPGRGREILAAWTPSRPVDPCLVTSSS